VTWSFVLGFRFGGLLLSKPIKLPEPILMPPPKISVCFWPICLDVVDSPPDFASWFSLICSAVRPTSLFGLYLRFCLALASFLFRYLLNFLIIFSDEKNITLLNLFSVSSIDWFKFLMRRHKTSHFLVILCASSYLISSFLQSSKLSSGSDSRISAVRIVALDPVIVIPEC